MNEDETTSIRKAHLEIAHSYFCFSDLHREYIIEFSIVVVY